MRVELIAALRKLSDQQPLYMEQLRHLKSSGFRPCARSALSHFLCSGHWLLWEAQQVAVVEKPS